MRINTNLTAMNTYSQYTKNNKKIASSVEKLSSGYSINSAADNAAGLAISEKMRAQIRGLDQASTNSQDAISLTQTAEGALSSSTEILQRMREIAVQSSNDTNESDVDREALQDEFSQLQTEIDDISSTTTFNKKNLLDGSLASTTKNVTNTTLGNNSLAISVGNASAGAYNFNVSVKQETAAVDASAPTSQSATFGTTAKNYFDSSSVALGGEASQSALLNGNYTLSSKTNTDGSITVTATGDGDTEESFTATITSKQLSDLATASVGASADLALKFSPEADDAFTLTVGITDFSNTPNGITTLENALADTTISVSGGVTAQNATYGVYASMTGGSDVKLATGDKSVTFDNGVTISFNALSASNLDTSSTANVAASAAITASAATGVTLTTATATLGNFKFSDIFTGANGAMTFEMTNANEMTATDAAGNKYTAKVDSSYAVGAGASGATIGKLTFTDTNGNTAFSTDILGTDTASAGGTVAFAKAGTAGTALASATVAKSGHNYSTVFGNGTTAAPSNKATSSFTVTDTKGAGLTFQVGANEGDELTINIDKLDSNYLGVASAKVTSQDSASAAIKTVDSAINQVSSQRAYLGAIENRLGYKIDNLNTTGTNLTSAESEIRDVDMASEMTNFTNAQILSQASTAMLAQANSLPQNVLSLLQ